MTHDEIEYWRNEIATTIVGLHERLNKQDEEYTIENDSDAQEELNALDTLCNLALEATS